jgi:AcrR family transcriptional regulator
VARQERGIRTRQLILESAGAVFAEHGYAGTTICDVYNRVGLTKGAFYFHFASKDELAEEVLAAQVGRNQYPVVPRELKLQELVDSGMVFAHALTYDPILQGSIRLSLDLHAGEIDRLRPFRAWIAQNLRALEEAREHGELHPRVDLLDTAELLVGSFSGVQVLSHALSGRRDLERRVSVLLSHLLPSFAVPGVVAKLDMAPDRGSRVLAEMRQPAWEDSNILEMRAA